MHAVALKCSAPLCHAYSQYIGWVSCCLVSGSRTTCFGAVYEVLCCSSSTHGQCMHMHQGNKLLLSQCGAVTWPPCCRYAPLDWQLACQWLLPHCSAGTLPLCRTNMLQHWSLAGPPAAALCCCLIAAASLLRACCGATLQGTAFMRDRSNDLIAAALLWSRYMATLP